MPRKSRKSRATSERIQRAKQLSESSCPGERSTEVRKQRSRCSKSVAIERMKLERPEYLGDTLYFANIKGEPYVTQALGILQSYDAVMEKLGSPLQMHDISSDPNENMIDRLAGKVQVKIPLTGSKGSSAYLYIWARRPPITGTTRKKEIKNWTLKQLDIELGPLHGWTFYVNTDLCNSDETLQIRFSHSR
ncbi:uncharacterized protein LOC110458641 [Mizuhopecten yessoensis]|uniref:Uncharacterized protein n=1 Tax=Mizuhopecten yessoensis TaxID=6573 RepID=A0A210Q6D0_MIZYE|nr:uncharacterized protein LOC110458641 [Mizuhopecten yessoensis]XP_021366108.1 uncharacterized protein LOC110458641 [Mizuhopecten yessoensis]OWF44249.1 hypothetical protein KP79_PYT24118 [Mizuhopecten yessoensis]